MHDASGGAPARVLAIGGLDSSGGSGLVRDFATAHELGVRVVLIPTALTIQIPKGIHKVDPRSPAELRDGLRQVLSGAGDIGAVKIGMVAGPALVDAVLEGLAGFGGPVVLDPVLGTSSGFALFDGPAAGLRPLLARAALVTPNAAEASALSDLPVVDLTGARAAARRLRQLGAGAVLVKGGHLGGAEAADLLLDADGELLLATPRVAGKDPRGTGCALATAIACQLARGTPLRPAVEQAKRWLHGRIAAAVERDGTHWL